MLSMAANGLPAVGIGSDTKPSIVGVTSRRFLMQANREPSSLLLHVDVTFKLIKVGYPVIVVGVSPFIFSRVCVLTALGGSLHREVRCVASDLQASDWQTLGCREGQGRCR